MQSAATSSRELHFESRGPSSSLSPILFIHGAGGDGSAFAAAAELLARKRRVVTYDRRGFSRSGGVAHAPRGYHRAHADDAARLLEQLKIERAAICGWSSGGLVALALAAHHPQKVSSLVLYEPPFHASRQLAWRPMLGYLRSMLWRALGRPRRAAAAFFRVTLGADFDRLPPERRERLLSQAEPLLHELRGGTGEELGERELQQITCPVTVLVGSDSGPVFANAADRLSRLLPRVAVIRVPGAGHGMPALQPLAFADAVDRALATSG